MHYGILPLLNIVIKPEGKMKIGLILTLLFCISPAAHGAYNLFGFTLGRTCELLRNKNFQALQERFSNRRKIILLMNAIVRLFNVFWLFLDSFLGRVFVLKQIF